MTRTRSERQDVICSAIQSNTSCTAYKDQHSCISQKIDAEKQSATRLKILGDEAQSKVENESGRFNKSFHSFRILVLMMTGFGIGNMMLLRFNLSVAIISMVNQTALYLEEHPDKTRDDFLAQGFPEGGQFHWNNEIQQMLLSWYMFTYTLPQILTTKISLIIGGRKGMPISLLICAISTYFTPSAAYWGWKWVLLLRLVQGFGASAVLPMQFKLVENWMSPSQYSLGVTYLQIIQVSVVATGPLFVGYLTSIHWSYAFYVPATITIVFCLLWFILVTDRPEENWFVSAEELRMIRLHSENEETLQSEKKSHMSSEEKAQSELKVHSAWLDVFKVPSFYILIMIWACHCNSFSVYLFIAPTYLRQVLNISVSQTGFYCFIIQSGTCVAVLWLHPFLKYLQTHINLSLSTTHKVAFVLATAVTSSTWFYVGFVGKDVVLMLFLNRCFHQNVEVLFLLVTMSIFSKAGLSSIVYSTLNTLGNLSVMIGSGLVGYALDYLGQTPVTWGYIFLGLGSTQVVVMLAYTILIKSDPIEIKNKTQSSQTSISTTVVGQSETIKKH